jgi:hypothetical protein
MTMMNPGDCQAPLHRIMRLAGDAIEHHRTEHGASYTKAIALAGLELNPPEQRELLQACYELGWCKAAVLTGPPEVALSALLLVSE